MITDDIVAAYHRTKWALILRGLLGLALGIFILARPLESVATFALVIAMWAIMDGIVNAVQSFELRGVVDHAWVLLLGGIVSVAFGVAALYYYPVLSLTFAVLWAAWWLITAGIVGVWAAIREKQLELPWGWTLTFGILALAAGALAIMYPGITLVSLMGMLAGFGVVTGIVMLVAAGRMQSLEHHLPGGMGTHAHA